MEGIFHNVFQEENVQILKDKNCKVLIKGKAGSGKTTLFLNRLVYLNQNEGIDYRSMLNIVASKEAVESCKRQMKAMLDEDSALPTFRTIYQLSYSIIRKVNELNGVDTPKIITDFSKPVAQLVQSAFGVSLNRYELQKVVEKLNSCKAMMLRDSEISEIQFDKIDFLYLYQKFEQFKQKNKIMGYEDMLVQAFQILSRDVQLLSIYRNNFRFIHVDDVQSFPFVAHILLKLLSEEASSVCMFMDEAKYTHPYRCAFPKALQDFSRSYQSSQVIELTQNYRNSSVIMEAMDTVLGIECAQMNESEEAFVRFLAARDMNHAYDIALQLAKREDALTYLCQERFTLLPLIDLFDQNDIPYETSSVQAFFQEGIVVDLIYLFRLILDARDLEAFSHVYKKIKFDIGEKVLMEVIQLVQSDENLDVYSALANSSVRLAVKNKIFSQLENIRLAKSFGSLQLLLFILNKLNYQDYMNSIHVGLQDPALLIFATMAQRYEQPQELLDRLCELERLDNEQIGTYKLLCFNDVQERVYPKACFLDGVKAFHENVFEDEDVQQSLIYTMLSKVQDQVYFIVPKMAFRQKMFPASTIYRIYTSKKGEAGDENKAEVKKKAPSGRFRRGDQVVHKTLGLGKVQRVDLRSIEILFEDGTLKKLDLKVCMSRGLLEVA